MSEAPPSGGPVRRGRWLRRFAIVAGFALIAVILTWPTARYFTSRISYGREGARTVPLFNLWTLEWNAQRIGAGWHDYWQAPIFHPTRGAFARSEAMPLAGVVFWLVSAVVGPVGGYNAVLLAYLTLNGLAVAFLVRRLGVALAPALLAGVLAQSLPFVFNELGVLQLVPVFPFAFAWERLVAVRRTGWRAAAGCGAWLGACALLSGYYALFLAVALGIGAAVLYAGALPWRRALVSLASAGVAAAAVAAPFLLAQQRWTSDARWATDTVEVLSARPAEFLALDDGVLRWPWLRDRVAGGQALFPGTMVVVGAVAGAVVAWRRGRRRLVLATAAAAVGLGLCALGLRLGVAGWQPYSLLRDHVPGFDRLRSPFRFGVVPQLLLVVLVAFALDALWHWRPGQGRAVAVLLVALSALETVPWPSDVFTVPAVASFDWVEALDDLPPGALAMVPVPGSGAVGDYDDTVVGMLAGLEHGHPLVNGYTGLFPDDYRQLRVVMLDFPGGGAVAALRARGVRYVVATEEWLDPVRLSALRAEGYRVRFTGERRTVFEDAQWSAAPAGR